MFYWVKTPAWVKKVYRNRIWNIDTDKKTMFLTFDDGPHPLHTPFVLETLAKYSAKATFFCLGKNVVEHPLIYEQIIEAGHAVGNHTYNHLNGWKVRDDVYLADIKKAKDYIDSALFRPPYGRISNFQVRQLQNPAFHLNTIMWTILSGDFDVTIGEERCLQNVVLNAKAGSIIVFHDSEKAAKKMCFALPRVLEYFTERGFIFEALTTEALKENGPG